MISRRWSITWYTLYMDFCETASYAGAKISPRTSIIDIYIYSLTILIDVFNTT